ncbi:VWA domain-containing protein [Haloarchaeobius sp. HRN-SO-5]|uniref:VWA domain-containing protein n=1 Tax=Haloarchaeobius sp. HRN-SO-5 TaxID=3446118 RepID=UPI003EB9099F
MVGDGGGGVEDGVDADRVAAASEHVRDELVRFVRALRRAGAAVPGNAATTAARALVVVGFDDEDRARAAVRACLVSNPADLATFDRQFPEFWRRVTAGLGGEGAAPRREGGPEGGLAPIAGEPVTDAGDADAQSTTGGDTGASDGGSNWTDSESLGALVSEGGDGADGETTETALYSPTGSPGPVTDAMVSPDETLATAFEDLTRELAALRGRRWTRRGVGQTDARRALRSSFGTGGTVVSVPERDRKRTAVRALWLVDVSRSVLDTVDRGFLLDVLRRARTEWRDARVFFFDEHLREVSTAFDEPTPSAALDALERAEAEWGGGTRIGDSLAELREDAPDAVDHRTVTFVVSDGLEMGDVSLLERELAWLARRSAGVIWLNPLAASPSYEPTARGMAAARPFVDGLFAFSGPADLAELARQLAHHGTGGHIGYEYDPRRPGTT